MSQGATIHHVKPRNVRAALALLPDFASIPISRAEAVAAIAPFADLDYDEHNVCCEWDENGRARGHSNCYGLFFLWAIRLELVPETIFERLHMAFALAGVAPVLRHYMDAQTRPKPFEERLPADWLLFRWEEPVPQRGEQAWGKGRHHVAMVTEENPQPLGTIFHAVDTDASGDGNVYYSPLMARDATQIVRVATLPQFDLGGQVNPGSL